MKIVVAAAKSKPKKKSIDTKAFLGGLQSSNSKLYYTIAESGRTIKKYGTDAVIPFEVGGLQFELSLAVAAEPNMIYARLHSPLTKEEERKAGRGEDKYAMSLDKLRKLSWESTKSMSAEDAGKAFGKAAGPFFKKVGIVYKQLVESKLKEISALAK